jgi:hypothetical protein
VRRETKSRSRSREQAWVRSRSVVRARGEAGSWLRERGGGDLDFGFGPGNEAGG